MSRQRVIGGRLYLTLELVAEVYEVDLLVLRRACDLGLLRSGVEEQDTLCIAAFELDRVATLVRLHQVLELQLEQLGPHL